MQLLTICANPDEILIDGILSRPKLSFLQHVLPDVSGVHQTGPSGWCLVTPGFLGSGRTQSARLVNPPNWGDCLYGLVRFVHAGEHALAGNVVIDAAVVLTQRTAVLAIGNGKSYFASLAQSMGKVAADDTAILVSNSTGGWDVCFRPAQRVRSRVDPSGGQPQHFPLEKGRKVVPLREIVRLEGTWAGSLRSTPSAVDSSSWLLSAAVGRVLNTRSYPECFDRLFGGSTDAAHRAAESLREFDVAALLCGPAAVDDYLRNLP